METNENKDDENTSTHSDCCAHKPKGSGIKSYIMLVMVAIVLLVSVVQSFQISALKNGLGGNAITGNTIKSEGIDMSSWTEDEKMMYEHHGTLPARFQSSNQNQNSNMVGGC